ncbi:hypothetical protein CRV00_03280 [Malaciobacter molluscorum]|uniref:YrbL family protein n=1 Tax=Malaciobacter molluscorum TaxID=1032072 RepID=UPI00100BF73F|nr:YrbL family protein [Malaciobacter molluscorum]RXJ96214.1 hypothetical protein CRV00_03280 [Malaciobacter molluscorum]
MIFLDESLYINKGTNRVCYVHPNDKTKCLKIDLKDSKETKRELKYYKKLIKKNIPFDSLSKYYGEVQTNLGKAEVFELIRDNDETISMEVDKYLNNSNNIEEIENLLKLVPLLKKYIFKNKIFVKDLNTVNIMYQQNGEKSRLVIIDGLSHSNYNPFFYICDYFINKKINKSWNGFINSLKKREIIKENSFLSNYLI